MEHHNSSSTIQHRHFNTVHRCIAGNPHSQSPLSFNIHHIIQGICLCLIRWSFSLICLSRILRRSCWRRETPWYVSCRRRFYSITILIIIVFKTITITIAMIICFTVVQNRWMSWKRSWRFARWKILLKRPSCRHRRCRQSNRNIELLTEIMEIGEYS